MARKPRARTHDGRDHTAPWHCSAFSCDRCAGKPSYASWWYRKQAQLAADGEADGCALCEGTGLRLRRVPGGVVSDYVPCFACDGTGRRKRD